MPIYTDEQKIRAAVITVSTLLGFLTTRMILRQNAHIKVAGKDDPTSGYVKKLISAISSSSYGGVAKGGIEGIKFTEKFDPHYYKNMAGEHVEWKACAITGKPGGHMASAEAMHHIGQNNDLKNLVGQLLASSIRHFQRGDKGEKEAYGQTRVGDRRAKATGGKEGLVLSNADDMYEEFGAYYGVHDDIVNGRSGFVSSARRLIETGKKSGPEGRRWKSGQTRSGLIHAGDAPVFASSFGSHETPKVDRWARANNDKEHVCGYCHGMNWAIMHAKLAGPWVTPYEIAVGTKTSKLASCFGCTTFMYATGYPPSAIHLGRAESWVPLPTNASDNPFYKGAHNIKVIEGLNALWAADVAGYLEIGTKIFAGSGNFKAETKAIANKVKQRVQSERGKDDLSVANHFLDALSVHENEKDRLKLVLN